MRFAPPTAQLRILPGTELVPVDDSNVLLRSFFGTLLLSGEFAAAELPRVVGLAGMDASIADLRDSVHGRFIADFDSFLELLNTKGLLVEQTHGSPRRGDAAYWQSQGKSVEDSRRSLAAATVTVAGSGSVAVTVANALLDGGVGTVRVASEGRTSCALHLNSAAVQLAGAVDDLANWDEVVAQSSLVVLCGDDMSLAGYDRTNETCNTHRVAWTSARVDRTKGILGPFVLPDQTACFACFELRSRANATHPSDHEALSRHWKTAARPQPEQWPIPLEFASMLGSAAAIDARRVLAGGFVSSVFGRMTHFDFHTLESSTHEVLKLPRCPVCSRTRNLPITRIWDLSESRAPQSVDS